MNRPAPLVQMALDYAAAYPEEIDADLHLAESRRREARVTFLKAHAGEDWGCGEGWL